jgi:hypothetical protein
LGIQKLNFSLDDRQMKLLIYLVNKLFLEEVVQKSSFASFGLPHQEEHLVRNLLDCQIEIHLMDATHQFI